MYEKWLFHENEKVRDCVLKFFEPKNFTFLRKSLIFVRISRKLDTLYYFRQRRNSNSDLVREFVDFEPNFGSIFSPKARTLQVSAFGRFDRIEDPEFNHYSTKSSFKSAQRTENHPIPALEPDNPALRAGLKSLFCRLCIKTRDLMIASRLN